PGQPVRGRGLRHQRTDFRRTGEFPLVPRGEDRVLSLTASGRFACPTPLTDKRGELRQDLFGDRFRYCFELPPAACTKIECTRLIAADNTRGPGSCTRKRYSETGGGGAA